MRKENKLRNRQMLMAVITALLLGVSATGCGSAKSDQAADVTGYEESHYGMNYEENVAEQDDMEEAAGGVKTSTNASDEQKDGESGFDSETNGIKKDNKKIIKRYDYSYETEEFDHAYEYLKQQIEAYDGYVSSSEIYGSQKRSLYLTARIPAEKSDRFVEQLGSLGTLISQSESAEDITLQYADTESRIASLKTEQERLLALLEKADSLESIIKLEDRLTEVRYELENYESKRKVYDDLVTYSTINMTLEEVNYTVPVDNSTFLTRIKTGLEKSFRDIRTGFVDFMVGFIVALPYLVIWGIIIFLIVWIIKKIVKRCKNKKLDKQKAEKKALQENGLMENSVLKDEKDVNVVKSEVEDKKEQKK